MIMKTFRGTKAIGWRVIDRDDSMKLTEELNELMEKYEFLDCQYSACEYIDLYGTRKLLYSALILLGEKE